MNQEAFQNIRVAAQMRPTHAPRVIEMREGAFDPLAALAHQAPAASSANPATIAIHRRLGLGLLRPIASPAVRLRHVGADAHGVEVDHRLITVIPLSAMISSSGCGSVTSACASSTCSAAAVAVSTIVVVSP